MDRVTVVRSVTHKFPVHGVAYAVTGMPTYTPELETKPRDSRQMAVHRLRRRLPGGPEQPQPGSTQRRPAVDAELEDRHSGQRRAVRRLPRPGVRPCLDRLRRQGHLHRAGYSENQAKRYHDPYGGTTASGRFRFSAGEDLGDVPVERLNVRHALLSQLDQKRRALDSSVVDHQRAQALHLLTSSNMRKALDVGRER